MLGEVSGRQTFYMAAVRSFHTPGALALAVLGDLLKLKYLGPSDCALRASGGVP